jgi:hypothetical protein
MPKTNFRPDTHGFAFINVWSFDPQELAQMQSIMHDSTGSASSSLTSSLSSFVSPLVQSIMQTLVGSAEPVNYGLCGGMAFAALDYFKQNKKLPRGRDINDQPRQDTTDGKTLRDYLWRRQLESMGPNFPLLIMWMGMLHLNVPFAGTGWLLERTREEWDKLKAHINNGNPWPICLIGTSTSPFDNHQVLAYGYEDPGDGTGIVYLYDMNCPEKEHRTLLDFRGHELNADESCPNTNRGPLRGFLCEVYRPTTPPDIREDANDNE